MEETAFEWELTNYPLMQATVDKLNPFLNLYETSMEFMNKQKTWFESPMGTHDPKVIIFQEITMISLDHHSKMYPIIVLQYILVP